MGNNDANESNHIFFSYARSDDPDQSWMPKLIEVMAKRFKLKTGRELRYFLDTHSIKKAQEWEKKIKNELEKSSVMVTVLTPSYFTSKMCGWEWDSFDSLQFMTASKYDLSSLQRLLYPIKLIAWDNVIEITDDQRRRMDEAKKIEWTDLQNLQPDTKEFEEKVHELTDHIIGVLQVISKTIPVGKLIMSRRMGFRFGMDWEQFVQGLSRATQATIIGTTNSKLVGYLNMALKKKRAKEGQDVFWHTLRIVFLSETMLRYVDDELLKKYREPEEAAEERIRLSGQAKRALSYFLIRQDKPNHWNLYEYDYTLPFVGALLVMANSEKIVQIAMFQPGLATKENLFFELSGSTDEMNTHFETTFNEVISRSKSQDEIILVGTPETNNKRFRVKHTRFRRSALKSDVDSNEWIAAVVILLWCKEKGEAWPLLQVRTEANAARELHKMSNISGYVNQRDCREFDDGKKKYFFLNESARKYAVDRELKEELGINETSMWTEPKSLDKSKFYYPDKENLYFYLYLSELLCPLDDIQPVAQFNKWSLHDILQVRKSSIFNSAVDLLNLMKSGERRLDLAAQVIAYNLILHKEQDLAERLLSTIKSGKKCANLKKELKEKQAEGKIDYCFRKKSLQITGLAGLHHREFFSSLLPVYANINIAGAKDYLDWLRTDKLAQNSLRKLKTHYQNIMALSQIASLGLEI